MTTTDDDAVAIQMAATERLERAETEARVAGIALDTLVLEAPLRLKVEAVERARGAEAELEAARAAYEAAQDIECPEATAIATRIAEELADGEFPKGLDWGDVGDMAETVRGLRGVSDRMFAEGEHAESEGR